jgi:hypothetical protein
VHYHHSGPRVSLDPVYHIINSLDYLVLALPRGLKLGRPPLCAGRMIWPHSVALLVTCAVGQFIVPSLHPVAGQPQMLACIVVNIT